MSTKTWKILPLILATALASSAFAAPKQAPRKTPTTVVKEPVTEAPVATSTSEDWKSPAEHSDLMLGALGGMGIVGFDAGFTVLGTASFPIVKHGFVPEISNSVSLEVEMGPVFVANVTRANYSAHLRWDFKKDDHWTLYALGGAAGYFGSGDFQVIPRVGLGAFYDMSRNFMWRFEVSHEVIALGVAFPLWF